MSASPGNMGSQTFNSGGPRNDRELGQFCDDRGAVATVTAAFEGDSH